MKLEDLLTSKDEPSAEQRINLLLLLPSLNRIEALYKSPLKITSGFRSWPDHKRIYRQINDARIITGRPEVPMPLRSAHLDGNAADIADPMGELKDWILDHPEIIEEEALYFEDFSYTPTWCHIQRVAPRSKKRFFIPF